MSYQVLARKWRPQDFSSLVGQEHVVTALRNALAEGRIAQAYLFSGIRGVGKTTAARVLAKALNCENGPAADPCNECPSCIEINGGGSMEVLEVDAATYSKVEQIRELTETLRYAPANNKRKVVVLDEVHRLSRQAFDALLKIVEEPPAHLVFIFATTEIDAVPATILSRCQEFQFRRVPSPVLAAYLRTICDAEDITVSDPALRLIARAGEGSVRDAVALLDQMATFGNGTIADEDAAQLLGGFDAALFLRLLTAVLDGVPSEVSAVAAEVEAKGWDPHHVFSQFLGFCRDGLHLAMGGEVDQVDLPREEAQSLADLVGQRRRGYEGLLQVLQLLLTAEPTVRRSEMGTIALEVSWLRAAELPKVRQIEDVLGGLGGSVPPQGSGPGPGGPGPGGPGSGGPPPGGRGPGGPGGSRGGGRSRYAGPRDADRPPIVPPAEPIDTVREDTTREETREDRSAPADPTPATFTGEADPGRIPDLLDLVAARQASLASLMRRAGIGLLDGELVIAPAAASERLLTRALERPHNTTVLEASIAQCLAPGLPWRIDPRADVPPAPESGDASAVADRSTDRPAARRSDPSRPRERARGAEPSRRRPEPARTEHAGSGGHDDAWQQSMSTLDDTGMPGDGDGGNQAELLDPRWDSAPDPSRRRLDEASLEAARSLPTVRMVQQIFGSNIQGIRDAAAADPDADPQEAPR